MKAKGARFYDDIFRLVFRERKTSKRLSWERSQDLAHAASKHAVGSVLDLGCGFGFLSRFVTGWYLGVDFSSYAVRKAQTLNPNNLEAGFMVADIRCLPLSDQFDTVAMLEVLEHLDNPAGAIATAKRLAKQRIVASVPRGKSRSGAHVWPFWDKANVENLMGPGTECDQYRRWWLAVWEVNRE